LTKPDICICRALTPQPHLNLNINININNNINININNNINNNINININIKINIISSFPATNTNHELQSSFSGNNFCHGVWHNISLA